uniref:Jacalin-type lectin domain-containing protein n=1 Tax=Ditylum brightwellii TaxID=49249 RepID=A0A7S4SRI8_9STRA|mmetsp:Transcript_37276/g.49460  ORF Transcript_37276/g.49460 Transcript_37276/m.49460 type:complete len:251 (+) Transcript_37276:58-810(+)
MSNNILFRFSGSPHDVHEFQWQPTHSNEFITDTMRNARGCQNHSRFFNDMDFYMRLKNRENTVKVELSGVRCRCSRYLFGICSRYTVKLLDGSLHYEWAPSHFFEQGYYSYHGGERQELTLELREGEYISGINIRQGEILDGLALVTNQRTVQFGGSGGSFASMSPPEPTQRIIAFAGTARGVMGRIGFFAEKISWEILGPLIMLRWLHEQNRATRSIPDTDCTQSQFAVWNLLNSSDDIFRRILCFLKP